MWAPLSGLMKPAPSDEPPAPSHEHVVESVVDKGKRIAVSTYIYTARPDRGGPVKGEMAGDSKAAVAAELRRKGMTVLAVDEKRTLPTLGSLTEGRGRIKFRDKVVFSRQFATMINAGLALLRALYILEEQTSSPRFRQIISQVRQDVEAGTPLSDAMEKHPVAFDRLYVSMVRAGEIGGVLDLTLDRLATQIEKDDSLRRSIKSAMTYPILIASFALLVLFGMILFIIPMFAKMYADLGRATAAADPHHGRHQQCPAAASGSSSSPASSSLYFGLRKLKRSKQGSEFWDKIKLRMPMKIGTDHPEDRRRPLQPHAGHPGKLGRSHPAGDRDHRADSGNTVVENAMEEVRRTSSPGSRSPGRSSGCRSSRPWSRR